MKIIEIKSKEDLLDSFWKEEELKGYTPSEKMDTSKLKYPVKFELNEKDKTFKIYVAPKPQVKQEVKEEKVTFCDKVKKHRGLVVFVLFCIFVAIFTYFQL